LVNAVSSHQQPPQQQHGRQEDDYQKEAAEAAATAARSTRKYEWPSCRHASLVRQRSIDARGVDDALRAHRGRG